MTRRRRLSVLALLALLGACSSPPPQVAAPNYQAAPAPKPNFVRVAMIAYGGVHYVPVGIDEVCCFNFVVDSGAADVSVSPAIFTAMMKSGRITRDDFVDIKKYQTANGVSEGLRFRIPTLTIGGITVHNVLGSVSKDSSMLLLGQSFLRKFKFWAIDNRTGELVLG